MSRTTQTLVHSSYLQSQDGQLIQHEYRLDFGGRKLSVNSELVLGASTGADVLVDGRTVSRRHARLVPGPRGIQVLDLGSKNGTFINGVRVTDALVQSTSRLRLGSTEGSLVVKSEQLVRSNRQHFGSLIGTSQVMQALFGQLELVAQSASSVLLLGESGTGKSEAARLLHDLSPRRSGPFVVVDCAALSENLAESDLFGHVRGAFTGAEKDRDGAFVRANGGTLHLDDVGALSVALQPRLLRALEARTVQPVGGTHPVAIDVRVIASGLPMLARGALRSDLYFRLSAVELVLPTLRERGDEDLALLATHFATELGGVLPSDFIERSRERPWPGNVRELRNHVERAVALGVLPSAPTSLREEDQERFRVEAALRQCAWNQSAAAKLLGISRGTLIARIEKFRLPRPRAR